MSEVAVAFTVDLPQNKAEDLADTMSNQGVSVDFERRGDYHIVPPIVFALILVPPGVALLADTINRIVHSWKDRALVVDASGEGPPKLLYRKEPQGAVVVIGPDGTTMIRDGLPRESASQYAATIIEALSGGSTVEDAVEAANDGS